MSYSYDKFLRPITTTDKNIQIIDNTGIVKYTINPFSVINVMISNFESIKKCFDKLLFSNENGDFKEYFISTFDNINNCSFKSYVVKERYGAGSKSIGINLSKQDAIRHSKLMYSPIFQEFIEGIEISVDAYVDSKNNVKGIILRKRELVINGESQITSTF